ncbi:MAG: maturase, partial [Firmicutes bacterium]|nr:maturase [Bacillota bacterium]
RKRKLVGLGVAEHYAATIAYSRKGYWFLSGNKAVNWALSKERLIRWGSTTSPMRISQCTSTIETAVYRTVRTVV